jgi:hypothetical protein
VRMWAECRGTREKHLPKFQVLARELEDKSDGIVIRVDEAEASIWVYRYGGYGYTSALLVGFNATSALSDRPTHFSNVLGKS